MWIAVGETYGKECITPPINPDRVEPQDPESAVCEGFQDSQEGIVTKSFDYSPYVRPVMV